MQTDRDFAGYGPTAASALACAARLAVSFVVNVEEGADFRWPTATSAMRPSMRSPTKCGRSGPCRDSHFEYGTRVGYWRIMRLLDAVRRPRDAERLWPGSCRSPWLARDAVTRGHEVACHGWRWERHAGMEEATERRRSPGLPPRSGGHRPAPARLAYPVRAIGQHTPAAPGARRFPYDSDAYSDDLPFFVPVGDARGNWSCPTASIPTTCIFTRAANVSPPRRISLNMSSTRSTSFGPKGRTRHG